MKKQDYHNSIVADITANEALEAISDVPAWWAKDFKGSAKRLRDRFTVTFGATFVDFEITELIPGKKVVWKVTDCFLHWIGDKHEWTGTSIRWEVTPQADGVRISMTHLGLVPEAECYEDCRTGWNHHFGESLFQFVTQKTGMPA